MEIQADTVLSTEHDNARPAVEIVVPVFNEERDLAASIRRLQAFVSSSFPFSALVTIADNGSTDGTWAIATALAGRLPGVRARRIPEAGRGRALQTVWSTSDAEVVAYMDVDLSTDLAALLPLVAPLLSGHSDLAIGTRLSGTARVVRGVKRELISRSYNAILHAVLATRFSDAQCGFKAIRTDRARALLPYVRDRAWFFDTELLVLAAATLAGVAGVAAGSLTRRRLAVPVGSLAVAAALLGPAAYSVQTAFASHGGALVAAGPATAQTRMPAGVEREAAEFVEHSGFAFAFGGNRPPGGAGGFGRGGGRFGGRDGAQTVSSAVVSRLEAGASRYRWVAATTSAPQAAPFELATGKPVMAIGGFMGTDNAITLPAFEQLVREGKVHYFIGGGFGPGAGPGGGPTAGPAGPGGNPGGGPGGVGFRGGTSTDAGQIATWVAQHYQPETVGGTTLYDLSGAASSAH